MFELAPAVSRRGLVASANGRRGIRRFFRMTFLNASLLAGLLAAAIPIAVHLMSRRKPQRVVFPATRFLKPQLESSRSRLRVQRWWLMALRILAVAALALALSRPLVETAMSNRWLAVALLGILATVLLVLATVAAARRLSAGLRYGLAVAAVSALVAASVTAAASATAGPEVMLGDESPVALAIVLDNSIRSGRVAPIVDGMNAAGEAGGMPDAESGRVIDRIREHAGWMVGRFPSDSRIAILDRSPRPAAFAVDAASALRQVERSEPLAQTRPLAERVEAAIRLVRSSDLPRRVVMVISDLTERSFAEESWGGGSLVPLLAQEPPLRLQILDVGSEPTGNRRLGPLTIADATPPRLTPTAVSTVISTEGRPLEVGDEASRAVTVELRMYDTADERAVGLPVIRDSETVLPPLRSVDRTTVTLGATASRIQLSVPPLETGTHHGVLRLVGDDELADDDQRFFTLQVSPPSSVLVVAADDDSARVIGRALTAPLAIDDPLSEYRIEISEWLPTRREAYREYDLIVLIDPASPTPAVVSDLQAYLSDGGKVVTLLGPTVEAGLDIRDSRLPARGSAATADRDSNTTLPAIFTDDLVRRWRVPEPGTFLEVVRPGHPSVRALTEVAGTVPWNAFRVQQYWQLGRGPRATVGADPSDDVVVIRYAGTDHPALVARGDSQLILTTPLPALAGPARGWNELFTGADAWPAFLLIRQMVQSLIDQQRGAQNLSIRDLPSIVVEAEQDAPLQMFPPRGPVVPLRASSDRVSIGNVDWPGTYWLRGEGVATGFSVNLDADQTVLRRLDPDRLAGWLGPDHYDLVRNRDEIRQAEGRGEPTRPLYDWLLLILIAAWTCEHLLANRFYRTQRRQAEPRPARMAA